MLEVDRLYIDQAARQQDQKPQPFSAYTHYSCIVLLGDPGLGKTVSLRQAADDDDNGIYLTISTFLNRSNQKHQGKTLYLDGVDERRSSINGYEIIDVIAGLLEDLELPNVRISCRSADWFGKSDLSVLSELYSGSISTLDLQHLNYNDLRLILNHEGEIDTQTFLEGALTHNILDQLYNPQTLSLYIEVFRKTSQWPLNRTTLYDEAISILVQETNDEHSRKRDENFTVTQIPETAENLSALLLLANLSGFSFGKRQDDAEYCYLNDISGMENISCLRATVKSRLFVSIGEEIVCIQHRRITEYLAAKSIVRRVTTQGLPFTRILAVLTGSDGGVLTDLRGLYAWLVTLLPQQRKQLISIDPYGAVIYGDPSLWDCELKLECFNCIKDLSERDPWFQPQNWSPILGFSSNVLIEPYREIIKSGASSHLLFFVFESLSEGLRLPQLGDDIIQFLRQENFPYTKKRAATAFIHCCPERNDDLKTILDEIYNNQIKDEDLSFRTILLEQLYPDTITPSNIPQYFSDDSNVSLISHASFIEHGVIERTPIEMMPELANSALKIWDNAQGHLRDYIPRLTNKIFIQLLRHYGASASVEEISKWLPLMQSCHFDREIMKEAKGLIETIFSKRKTLYFDLIILLSHKHKGNTTQLSEVFFNLEESLLNIAPPHSIVENLINQSLLEEKVEVRLFFFSKAINYYVWYFSYDSSLYNSFWCFVENNPEFMDIWKKQLTSKIDDWRWKQWEHERKNIAKKEKNKKNNISILSDRLELIRSGKDHGNLIYSADLCQRKFLNNKERISEIKFLTDEFNESIANALLEGLKNLALSTSSHSVNQINICHKNGKPYPISRAYLMGIELIARQSQEYFLSLPEENLRTAMAYRFSQGHSYGFTPWEEWLICEKTLLVNQTLEETWSFRIDNGEMDALPSLYGFGFTESLKLPACQASLKILKARSDIPPNILSQMLVGILQIIDISEITELVNNSLSNKTLSPEQETLWRSLSLLLANQDLVNESTTYLHNKVHESKEHKHLCYKLLFQINNTPIFSQDPSLKALWLYRTISILGNVFPHTERESDSRRSTDSLDSQEIIRCIEHLISSLSALTTDESLSFIIKLLKPPELSSWSNHLKHASSTLKKKLREKNYHYLTTQDACNLLQGGKPATMRDLMEVFVDALTDTQKDIRYGNGDSWKLFWDGLDKYGRLKPEATRKVENECRNIILDRLKPKLEPLKINV